MPSVSYRRAVGSAALQAAVSSTWIAARELTPARRRLARVATVAAGAVVAHLAAPPKADPVVGANPFPVGEGAPPAAPDFTFDKRRAAVGAGVVALSVAAVAGRRLLEKRWLARLTRAGHPHPTRALAVRMAAVEFAGQLALQLPDVRTARQALISGSAGG